MLMEGMNTGMRTCSGCSVKNLCCERCLERRRQYRAKGLKKVKERNIRYKEKNEEQINAYRKESSNIVKLR